MQVKTGDAIVGNALWDTRFGLEGFQSGQVASSWEGECWVGLACLSLLLRCGWLGVVLCGSCCFVGRLCWSRVGSGSRGQNGYLVGDRMLSSSPGSVLVSRPYRRLLVVASTGVVPMPRCHPRLVLLTLSLQTQQFEPTGE